MFLVSDYDVVQGMDRVIIIFASIVVVIGAICIGLLFLSRMQKAEMNSQKFYFLGIGLFAFLVGFSRFVFLYHDYFADNALDLLLWRLANVLAISGLTMLDFTIETNVFTKTKHSISIFGVVSIFLVIFLPKVPATIMVYVASITLAILPLLIYIYISRQTAGEIRKSALLIVLGMILMFVSQFAGAMLFNLDILGRTASQIFAFSTVLVGLVVCTIGFIKGPGAK